MKKLGILLDGGSRRGEYRKTGRDIKKEGVRENNRRKGNNNTPNCIGIRA